MAGSIGFTNNLLDTLLKYLCGVSGYSSEKLNLKKLDIGREDKLWDSVAEKPKTINPFLDSITSPYIENIGIDKDYFVSYTATYHRDGELVDYYAEPAGVKFYMKLVGSAESALPQKKTENGLTYLEVTFALAEDETKIINAFLFKNAAGDPLVWVSCPKVCICRGTSVFLTLNLEVTYIGVEKV